MSAQIQVLDAMLNVAVQMSRSPDVRISTAATDEIRMLAERRKKVLSTEAHSREEASLRELALEERGGSR